MNCSSELRLHRTPAMKTHSSHARFARLSSVTLLVLASSACGGSEILEASAEEPKGIVELVLSSDGAAFPTSGQPGAVYAPANLPVMVVAESSGDYLDSDPPAGSAPGTGRILRVTLTADAPFRHLVDSVDRMSLPSLGFYEIEVVSTPLAQGKESTSVELRSSTVPVRPVPIEGLVHYEPGSSIPAVRVSTDDAASVPMPGDFYPASGRFVGQEQSGAYEQFLQSLPESSEDGPRFALVVDGARPAEEFLPLLFAISEHVLVTDLVAK